VRIKTDERTFKTLADQILHMKVISESQCIERAALINSAKSYIDSQIMNHQDGYRPLEFFASCHELARRNIRIFTVKRWINHNLNVFEKKSSGRLTY
jgi:hypothetical protein